MLKKLFIMTLALISISAFADIKLGTSCDSLTDEKMDSFKVRAVFTGTSLNGQTATSVHLDGKQFVHYIVFDGQDIAAGLAFSKGQRISVSCTTDVLTIEKL